MKVAIIGAGCSGLASARYCLEKSLECDVYEQASYLGGIWNYNEEVDVGEETGHSNSVMYKNLM